MRRKVDKGSLELTFYKPPADVEDEISRWLLLSMPKMAKNL
ncbi:hypothetical protein [Dehalobacterium formicoaceticum]|uniref:Uncharacterized protein n=1 Tax=Dehalobacterium formicoaceticum TaxID=51515 RepID=A0ABT1Y581_9FIRM|nr:hypothetical protein [Dehalobacterium formicoaceticum]MCR6546032.1 hypothetical protein [Dehalobacterium formicoaceticum]